MPKMKGLGRGLDALFMDNGEQAPGVREIPIVQIDPNHDQPRTVFDENKLLELAESIKTAGVLQPLLVTEEDGRFRIVAGERRWRAARLAGLSSVPCVVREFSEAQRMEAALIENLQREDLNAVEEASAIQALIQQCGYTQEAAAKRLGMSRPAIANALRLLGLAEPIQKMIRDGALSAGHARALLAVGDPNQRLMLAQEAVRDKLSVRETEKRAADTELDDQPKNKPKKQATLVPELKEFENRLRESFGVRATVTGSLKQGKIVLVYHSEDELDRLYETISSLFGDS